MNVQILELLEGAKRARGLAVVIDVFRAFSLEAWLFARGAKVIYAVGAEETARAMKAERPDAVLIGERGGKILPGFDFGNSPSQTEGFDWNGKTVIHTTSAGTQGLVAAGLGADEIITGALVNASAVARYIAAKWPETVTLVAMGWNAAERAPEDWLCARYIAALLEGKTLDKDAELAVVRAHREGAKFFDPARQEIFPEADYWQCVDFDRFDFVLRAHRESDQVFRMERVELS
ncbi:MAG: 2-phosphosulfolactate phosphatase [Pyramidobacter sp.]|nr:2-phosphosulfolactate phosphatase [Pyramidobacter sp.]